MNVQRNESGDIPNNIIKLDPIAMLIWMLSAIFHDPIHDFGLSIERMSKIVLYIEHLVQELNPIQQGGSMSYKTKGGRWRPPSVRLMSSKRSLSNKPPSTEKSHSSPIFHTISKKMKSPTARTNKSLHTNNLLHTISENRRKNNQIYKQIYEQNVVFPLPISNDNPYVGHYAKAANIAKEMNENNNPMLEMFIQVNHLIDSIKLSLVQHILTIGIFTKESLLMCIGDVITQTDAVVRHDNSEIPEDVFQRTKQLHIFILETMWRLIHCMRIRVPANDERMRRSEEHLRRDDSVRRSQDRSANARSRSRSPEYNVEEGFIQEQQQFLWLNLLNGSLFEDIMRVIVFGKCIGIQEAPQIPRLYSLFLQGNEQRRNPDQGGGGRGYQQIMSGGAKMKLASFRERGDDEKRNDLKEILNAWNTLRTQVPPADIMSYTRFYTTSINNQRAENRVSDSRLIRTLDMERFDEVKKKVEYVNRLEELRRNPPARATRSLEDPTTIKDVIDSFMYTVKSDFDSLLAEEQLAIEAEAEAEAAQPITRGQRAVVYKFSKIIAKKGLEYALAELQDIQRMALTQETQIALPNIAAFLPDAIRYIQEDILANPGAQARLNQMDMPDIEDIAYVEKDKYKNLLFQLYLLGLIYKHNGMGGLPDIDSQLAANIVDTFQTREHQQAYEALDYIYLDNVQSQLLFQHIRRRPAEWRTINNSVPSGIRTLIQASTVCNVPARVDAAASFGGCDNRNHEFHSMVMTVMDLEERNIYFTKHEYNNYKVSIKYNFNLRDLVIGNKIPDINLNTAPNVLSANRVFKEAIDIVLNFWKENKGQIGDGLWGLLELDDKFKQLMSIITKKGKGDIDQENSVLAPNAGYDGNDNRIRPIIAGMVTKNIMFAGGDRPSSVRAINALKYGRDLLRGGRLVVSYANEQRSFTIAHRDCIPGNIIQRRVVGGSRKRRVFRKNRNHTRKKRM